MAADDDTTTQTAPPAASPDILAQAMQLAKQFMPQQVQQDTTPVSRSGISLLGEALAGGAPVAGMSDADKETAGTRALMNFSTGLMAASRYQPGQTIFSNLAQGFQGAQRGEIGAEEMAMAKLGAQQEYAQQQGQNKLEALKTALPLLQTQLQMRASGAQTGALGGNTPPAPNVAQGGSIADPAAALPKDQALAAVVQRESGGKNIPTAILGPDGKPASTATGYYQMLDNTWQEGAALAGIKNPPPRAMDASKADQDAAASALYDKYKLMPWAKSAPVAPTTPASGAPAATTAPPAANTPEQSRAVALAQAKDSGQPVPIVNSGGMVAYPDGRIGTPGGGFKAAPTPAAASTPPATPTAPPGTIQGTPDTGGAQVAGPGALPGKIAPPGPAVPGVVSAIIGGMKGAGADPTTLAPGAATAGPAAPAGSTVVASNAPPPQPTPPAPGGKTSPFTGDAIIPDPHDANASYPSFVFRPTPGLIHSLPPEAQQQFQQNEQQLLNARASSVPGSPQQKDFDQQLADLRKQHNQDITTYGQTQDTNDSNRQLEAFKANAAAWNAIHQTQITSAADIAKARIQAGLDQETQAQKSDQERWNGQLKNYSDAAGTAEHLQPQYEQLRAVMTDPNAKIPSGALGGLLQAHPNLAGYLSAAGVISGHDADQVQLINGLTNFLSVEMRPTGTGALRGQEMTNFKSALPTLMESQQGKEKALAFLLNYNDRVMDENTFAQDYYMRPDANGQPTHNLLGLQKAMDAPPVTDPNTGQKTGGGLGEVVPHMPNNITNGSYDDARGWIQSNIQPGRPYYGPEALKDSKGRPLLNQDGSQKVGLRLQVRNN